MQVWSPSEMPELVLNADGAADLQLAHMHIVVMDHDQFTEDDRMGIATLALEPLAADGGAFTEFNLVVVKDSARHGRISGRMAVCGRAVLELGVASHPHLYTVNLCSPL